MSFFTYTRDIPDGPNNPSQDQPKMKINNNSVDSLIEIDHYGFNDNLGGYHNIIHQPVTTDPAPIASINQVYAKTYIPDSTGAVADTQLFNMTGLGGISQLTGNNANNDGWVWSGGLLFQWGRVVTSLNTTGGTVAFKDRVVGAIRFPSTCFMVVATPFFTAVTAPTQEATVAIKGPTATQFTWVGISSSNSYAGFFWYAVGN